MQRCPSKARLRASPAADLGDRPVSTVDPQAISEGRTTLGIELGSSRIKAVLIGPDHEPLATGAFAWENQLVDRLWTYSLEAAWQGIQACYRDLAANVLQLPRCAAPHGRGHRDLGDDARLPGLRRQRGPAGPFPHLAQHQHRPGRRAAE